MSQQIRSLVLGGGGFIGHHLARHLKEKGHFVRGVDLNYSKHVSVEDFDEAWSCDLKNFNHCLDVTKGMDWVFNLAALNGSIEFTTNNHAELIHNNALVNLNMAEACYRNKIKKVFFSSSACVYPIHYQETDKIHPLKESDVLPAHPDTEYGWEKLFSEHVYQSYAQDRGMDIRIARFINVYGTECLIDTMKSKAPMALTRKVIEAGNGGDVKIWGNGGQKRTFCYIDDLLEGIDILMNSNVTSPVNLGSDELFSINELVDLIADIEGVSVNKVHQLDKVQGVRVRTPDLSLIKSLGWKPKVSITEGLRKVNEFVHKELKI